MTDETYRQLPNELTDIARAIETQAGETQAIAASLRKKLEENRIASISKIVEEFQADVKEMRKRNPVSWAILENPGLLTSILDKYRR